MMVGLVMLLSHDDHQHTTADKVMAKAGQADGGQADGGQAAAADIVRHRSFRPVIYKKKEVHLKPPFFD